MEKRKRNTKLVTFESSPILLDKFDVIIHNKGIKRSEVIRQLMNEYIEKNDK